MLKLEQLALDVETAAVTAQRATRCDHPVAGDDDSDRIPVVGHADGAVGMWMTDGLRNVTIAAGLAIWNFKQSIPAGELDSANQPVRQSEF